MMEATLSQRMQVAELPRPWKIRDAEPADSEWIAEQRHEVYARELGQLPISPSGSYRDSLDARNRYIVLEKHHQRAGFISITPPDARPFSIHKYFSDAELAFLAEGHWFEVRLLTLSEADRGGIGALLLMYAAFRWVQCHGGQQVVILGRDALEGLYREIGFTPTGRDVRAGDVRYLLMTSCVRALEDYVATRSALFERLERRTQWALAAGFRSPARCFHGGSFFTAIGERFEHLERRDSIVNADVLDAWFPPAPGVLDALSRHLDWLSRTSPPTDCRGFIEVLAHARRVPAHCLLPGAGSSDLIFRSFLHWLTRTSNVLLLDPTYGEYGHVLEKVMGCQVQRLVLQPEADFVVPLAVLEQKLQLPWDLVILVNPNSPTGRLIPRDSLEALLRSIPSSTRIWVDETYIEYAGSDASIESFAAASKNVFVCKSMSKVYALSGCRVAYLCGPAAGMESLRAITPPWVIGLPSQVAAVRALEDPQYYAARYAETRLLRSELATELRALGILVSEGIANFVLCRIPETKLSTSELVRACARDGVFLRDASSMGSSLDARWIRIAVKDRGGNQRVVDSLRKCLA